MYTAIVFILSPAQSIFSTKTSQKVHFLYNNFPKKSIFSTTTSPKSRFSLHKHPPKKPFFGKNFQKNRSPKPRVGTPPGGGGVGPPCRPADPRRPCYTKACFSLYGSVTKRGYTPFFARFLSCTSIIFFLVPAGAPKWCFFKPQYGSEVKKNTTLGLVVALRKKL